jgi:hypothetical protein
MTTLTDFLTKTAQILADPSYGKFDTTELTQAVRQALADYDSRRPAKSVQVHEADGLRRQVLDVDFQPIDILGVEEYDDDPSRDNEIAFLPEYVDGQWQFETDPAITAGTSLNIKYSASNTILNLDDGGVTTILIGDFEAFCIGAAGYALLSRSIDKSESINLQEGVQAALEKTANQHLNLFRKLTPAIKAGATLSHSPYTIPAVRF